MTKQGMIEQVFLALSGGKLSADVKVERADIAHYLPVAVNAALLKDFYERRNMAQQDRASGDIFTGREDVDGNLFQTFSVIPESTSPFKTLTLPSQLLSMPFSRGLNSVYQDPDSPFVKINGPLEVAGLPNGLATFFWQEGNTLKVKGLECTDAVSVRMAVDSSSLADTDELPIPLGRESDVLQNILQFFGIQLRIPADVVNNNTQDV